MMYKAKVAVCSDIRTEHSTQSECHVEFFERSTWWYVKKPLGFKRLMSDGINLKNVVSCVFKVDVSKKPSCFEKKMVAKIANNFSALYYTRK